jgi:hypothetical protein
VLGGQLVIASRLTHRDAGPAANGANHTKFVMTDHPSGLDRQVESEICRCLPRQF